MADILPPAPIDAPFSSYNWVDWYKKVRDAINNAASVLWTSINFTGSNITDIVTRNHNDLQNIQGGTAGQYYHLTAAEYAAIGPGAVTSVFGRAGAVVAVAGDYSAADITGFDEAVDDRTAALCVAGTNMTITYNDVANTLTFDASGGGGGLTSPQILARCCGC